MATSKSSLNHLERTATEPRDKDLHKVTINKITQISPNIRLFHLQPQSSDPLIKHFPGQWVDLHIPSIPKAGGFTITSPPSTLLSTPPYLELAIQKSPGNKHAAWLWQDEKEIMGKELGIRVGGGFVWPPEEGMRRVVFVAGGVGINPLVSMIGAIAEEREMNKNGKVEELKVKFLYSTRMPEGGIEGWEVDQDGKVKGTVSEEILFLPRLLSIQRSLGTETDLELYLTSGGHFDSDSSLRKGEERLLSLEDAKVKVTLRRITEQDLIRALGPVEERSRTVCYICGVPSMTDEFVERAREAEGMIENNVLFEKWW